MRLKVRNKRLLLAVLAVVLVASIATFLLSASADSDLSDENVKVELTLPEGDLEEELRTLSLYKNKLLDFQALETILKSSDEFSDETFQWITQNYLRSDYRHDFQQTFNMVNKTRTNKSVTIMLANANSIRYEDYIGSTIEPLDDSTQHNKDENEKITDATEELEEILEGQAAMANQAQPASSPTNEVFSRTFLKNGLRSFKDESDIRYAVHADEGIAGITEASKLIKENQKFRYIDVELKIVPKTMDDGSDAVDADIVLVLDASNSMSGNETAGIDAKWDSVVKVADQFIKRIFEISENSRVGVVYYKSGNPPAAIASPLRGKDDLQALLDSYKRVTPSGSTNAQSGLIKAREVLGMTDETIDITSDGRKKIVINLTDGMPNTSYTDTFNKIEWTTPSDPAQPKAGYRRWGMYGRVKMSSWNTQEANIIGVENSRWLNDSDINQNTKDYWKGNNSVSVAGAQIHGEITYVLEAQFMVNQGVDLYAIDYSTEGYGESAAEVAEIQRRATEILNLSTYKMVNPPQTFRYSPARYAAGVALDDILSIMETNPIENSTYDKSGYEGRVYRADNAEELLEAFEDILIKIQGKVPIYTVNDYFNAEIYELVGQPTLAGADVSSGSVTVNGSNIKWTSGGQSSGEARILRYQLRVKDDKNIYPWGAGKYNENAPSGSEQDKVPTGSKATIEFTQDNGNTFSYDFEIPVISIQRLIDGEAIAYDSSGNNPLSEVFSEKIYLGGNVTRGNGAYTYQWFKGQSDTSPEITSGKQPVNSIVQGNQISVPLPKTGPITETNEGKHYYTLKLFDELATGDGYRQEGVSYILRILEVDVATGEITIIVEADGAKTKGLFETRVTKGLDNVDRATHDRWYFLGPDTKTYKVSLFVNSENYPTSPTHFLDITAQTYIPYGYEVSVRQGLDGVTIEPGNIGKIKVTPSLSSGVWTIPARKIVIDVKKVERNFFYDWTWGPSREDTIIFDKQSTVK